MALGTTRLATLTTTEELGQLEQEAVSIGTTQKTEIHPLCRMCILAVVHALRFCVLRFISAIIKAFGNPYKSTA
jgi:hypothetical protein